MAFRLNDQQLIAARIFLDNALTAVSLRLQWARHNDSNLLKICVGHKVVLVFCDHIILIV